MSRSRHGSSIEHGLRVDERGLAPFVNPWEQDQNSGPWQQDLEDLEVVRRRSDDRGLGRWGRPQSDENNATQSILGGAPNGCVRHCQQNNPAPEEGEGLSSVTLVVIVILLIIRIVLAVLVVVVIIVVVSSSSISSSSGSSS